MTNPQAPPPADSGARPTAAGALAGGIASPDIVDLLDSGSLDPFVYEKASTEIKRLRRDLATKWYSRSKAAR